MTRFPEIGSEALEYGNGLTEKIFKVLVGEEIQMIGSSEVISTEIESRKKTNSDEF